MPIQYINRQGQTYYLHVGVTKTEKPKYFVSLKTEGTLAEIIPPGFEIYENPNGQVIVRKSLEKLIFDAEMATVEQAAERLGILKGCQFDRRSTILTVYFADRSEGILADMISPMMGRDHAKFDEILDRYRRYSPLLQFILVDAENRIFRTRRYCFRGFIDDWIDIGRSATITELSQKYLSHLGKDSYYELF